MTELQSTVFFIDRCLGSIRLATALRESGITVEIHDDHFLQGAQDEDWLPQVGEWGWVVLTKDANIAKRTSERLAVANAKIRMFVLAAQNLPGEDMIAVFRKAFPAMREFARENPSPFIAKVYRDGRVEAWKPHTELLDELADMMGH
jgi:predicted nuclease of predicted toxin-antitoxin system